MADASVWINLVATDQIDLHLRLLNNSLAITDVAFRELERGRNRGRHTAEKVGALVRSQQVAVNSLPAVMDDTFMSLVSGAAHETLDDGEAATLVCASFNGSGAVIDERKATTLAARRFPEVALFSTVDILLSPHARAELSEEALALSLYNALVGARMRVPDHYLVEVCVLLGPDRVARCRSLPAAVRLGDIVREA